MVLVEDQQWTVKNGYLIRNEKDQCPICALVDVLSNGELSYTEAAGYAWDTFVNEPDLENREDRWEIMNAADLRNASLRKELEEALHVNQ